MELILYYIVESRNLLISFLILTFILGTFAYLSIRKFKQDKKMKIFIYGLFLKMSNIDIVKLSIVILKTFLVIYATIVTEELNMWLCIAMLAVLTIIYIVCEYKRFIYEIVYTLVQIIIIYLIYLINHYMAEIEQANIILGIKICLVVFELILSVYLLFRNVNMIAEDRVAKNFKKEQKRTLI
ncbi:MAG: hypothetical protein ACLS90_01350 [Clostridia bacterium]